MSDDAELEAAFRTRNYFADQHLLACKLAPTPTNFRLFCSMLGKEWGLPDFEYSDALIDLCKLITADGKPVAWTACVEHLLAQIKFCITSVRNDQRLKKHEQLHRIRGSFGSDIKFIRAAEKLNEAARLIGLPEGIFFNRTLDLNYADDKQTFGVSGLRTTAPILTAPEGTASKRTYDDAQPTLKRLALVAGQFRRDTEHLKSAAARGRHSPERQIIRHTRTLLDQYLGEGWHRQLRSGQNDIFVAEILDAFCVPCTNLDVGKTPRN